MTGTKFVARRLRRIPTKAEQALWFQLRNRRLCGVKFRRQHPIAGFVADFANVESRLVVEIDGGQHCPKRDDRRTAVIEAEGWRLIRFWNNEVLENMDGVLHAITKALSPPQGGEGLGEGGC
ncbi:MAG: endonuclease domain-containing protein [Alphaproteobacteria bacterium]